MLSLQPGNVSAPSTIPHNQSLSKMGSKGWLLNLGIFVKVWDLVHEEGVFRRYDVTVKVDPDSVFIPSRMMQLVSSHDPNKLWFLHNCKQPTYETMQGSLETLSRAMVDRLGNKTAREGECSRRLTPEYVQEHWQSDIGEDQFMNQCLGFLGGVAKLDTKLIADMNCGWPEWASCGSVWRPAYHHFKYVGQWESCMYQSLALK